MRGALLAPLRSGVQAGAVAECPVAGCRPALLCLRRSRGRAGKRPARRLGFALLAARLASPSC
eukprot:14746041-Alexandrium_andersonii.AAC.1